jgi:hypothetical protein
MPTGTTTTPADRQARYARHVTIHRLSHAVDRQTGAGQRSLYF